jgi:TRAP transporter 4TM/12TM fusion protein
MAILLMIAILEATRRRVGFTLPILVIIFLLYGFFGPLFPEIIMHRGLDLGSITASVYMGEEGIFGTPLAVAADFIMIYIVFGAFLRATGAGELFIKLADSAFGWCRGGPAKAAVVSSALMGTISGSAVANVVTTGTFTIPLMKRTGYKSEIAGAVEAVASTGGQIAPPVMGAAAFIMADFLQVPYWTIVKAAFIPAFLYYLALFFAVDLEAVKSNLKGLPREKLPAFRKTIIEDGHLLIPIVVLIYFMGVAQVSPQLSAFWSIIVAIAVSMFRPRTRMNMRKFAGALVEGAIGGLEVATVCACAGIVIGLLMRTGLGMALTGILIDISGGNLILLMVLTAVVSTILGMGLPTSACYIIVAVLISPAMIKLGVLPMASHLFAFYFACLSTITPPVALAAYAASSIAGSDPMRTGFQSMKLGACGFIVPFMFVFGTDLLMVGSFTSSALVLISSSIGVYGLAIGLTGYQFRAVPMFFRLLYITAAILLIKPGIWTDLAGVSLIAILSFINSRQNTANEQEPSQVGN